MTALAACYGAKRNSPSRTTIFTKSIRSDRLRPMSDSPQQRSRLKPRQGPLRTQNLQHSLFLKQTPGSPIQNESIPRHRTYDAYLLEGDLYQSRRGELRYFFLPSGWPWLKRWIKS